jgi:hypothetical protein
VQGICGVFALGASAIRATRGPWYRSLAASALKGGSHTSALRHYSLVALLNPLSIEHLDDLKHGSVRTRVDRRDCCRRHPSSVYEPTLAAPNGGDVVDQGLCCVL